jgi:hypothetical protein
MKKCIIIFLLSVSIENLTFATQQKPDFLIIENDTILLKSFPLEELGFKISPFKFGKYGFHTTGCWRGYQATWKVIEDRLFLIDIVKDDSTKEKLNIDNYFKENKYSPQILNGLIFADWFTADLEPYFIKYSKYKCLLKSYQPKKSKAKIKFEKGIMIENKYKSKK